jgi:hypothetical protein
LSCFRFGVLFFFSCFMFTRASNPTFSQIKVERVILLWSSTSRAKVRIRNRDKLSYGSANQTSTPSSRCDRDLNCENRYKFLLALRLACSYLLPCCFSFPISQLNYDAMSWPFCLFPLVALYLVCLFSRNTAILTKKVHRTLVLHNI